MTVATARLSLKVFRAELLGVAVLVGLAAIGAVIVTRELASITGNLGCVGPNDGMLPPGCEAVANRFYQLDSGQASPVMALLQVLPFIGAILVGAALLARELERGTARLAWSLAPSRLRWYLGRMLPVLAAVIAISLLAGVIVDVLFAARQPGIDTANGFLAYGFRGMVLAARATFVFAVAVLVGALLPRTLPAILLAGVVATLLLAGGSKVHDKILEREAVLMPATYRPENLYFGQRFQLPDGRIVGWEEMQALYPPPQDGTTEWPTLPELAIAVPGSRYLEVQLRETGVLAAGSLAALLLAAGAVRRLRPG